MRGRFGTNFGSFELQNFHQNMSGKLLQNDHYTAAKQNLKLLKERPKKFNSKTYEDFQSIIGISLPSEYEFEKKFSYWFSS